MSFISCGSASEAKLYGRMNADCDRAIITASYEIYDRCSDCLVAEHVNFRFTIRNVSQMSFMRCFGHATFVHHFFSGDRIG